MRIVTLDIKRGGGTRIERIGRFVAELNAGVLLLTKHRVGVIENTPRCRLTKTGYRRRSVASDSPKAHSVLLATNTAFTTDGSASGQGCGRTPAGCPVIRTVGCPPWTKLAIPLLCRRFRSLPCAGLITRREEQFR